MTFEIRSDLPMPASGNLERAPKYPVADLSVGECFIVPADRLPKGGKASIMQTVQKWRHKTDNDHRKFRARVLDNGDLGVWRVE